MVFITGRKGMSAFTLLLLTVILGLVVMGSYAALQRVAGKGAEDVSEYNVTELIRGKGGPGPGPGEGEGGEISSCDELQNMENDLSADYTLAKDITDCSGFDPVGDDSNKFTGSLDGQGHTITGLSIDGNSDHLGLFGVTGSGAEIKNVKLENADITGTGHRHIGVLVGKNKGSIKNSYASGSVEGTYNVGGLVGSNEGSIVKSYASVSVNAAGTLVGGLVGLNKGSIEKSSASGSVDAVGNYVGGLVGQNGVLGESGSISNAYALGSVSGNADVGGLVGRNYGSISKTYAVGSVSGDAGNIKGLVGRNSGGSCSNCFWDTSTTEQSDDGCDSGSTGKTTTMMKTLSTFTDTSTEGLNNAWDFEGTTNDDSANEDIWKLDSVNSGYPYLWQAEAIITFIDQDNNLKWYGTNSWYDPVHDTGKQASLVGGVADIGGDGDLDIAFADTSADEYLKWYDLGDGSVHTSEPPEAWYSAVPASAVGGVADIDDDGSMDIAVASQETANTHVEWYDTESGELHDTGEVFCSPGFQRVGGIADIGEDGDMDITFSGPSWGNCYLKWYSSGDTQSYGDERIVSGPGGIADIGEDGDMDIVFVTDTLAGTYKLKWYDTGSDSAHEIHTFTEIPSLGADGVADIGGDGDLDILFEVNGKLKWYDLGSDSVHDTGVDVFWNAGIGGIVTPS